MTSIVAITGAASGIGRGTVFRMLDEGWTVIGLDLSLPAVDRLDRFDAIDAGGQALFDQRAGELLSFLGRPRGDVDDDKFLHLP